MSEWDPEGAELAEWHRWLDGRPESVRKVAGRLPPWKRYRLKSSGRIVHLVSYDEMEDDTVTVRVRVLEDPNVLSFVGGDVFGLAPDDLEEVA